MQCAGSKGGVKGSRSHILAVEWNDGVGAVVAASEEKQCGDALRVEKPVAEMLRRLAQDA